MTEYVRVTPTSEQVTKENLPAAFESLHKLSNPATSKLTRLLPNTVKQRESNGIPPNVCVCEQPNRIRWDASATC